MKKQTSGIYAIVNKKNRKRYVGSSKRVYYRWRQQHLPQLRKDDHYNKHLQRAWNKYGEEKFEFVIMEECDESVLEVREGYWIEHFESWHRNKGYNLTRLVGNRVVRYDQERHDAIMNLFNKKTSKKEISKRLNVSRSTVYSCLEINGLHENTGRGNEIKLTEEVKEQVVKLRDEGKSWQEIVDAVPVSETQLHRANVIVPDGKYQTNKVKRKTYRTVTPDVIKKANQLRINGKTWEQIEVELGVSRFALYQNGITKMSKPISSKGCPKKKMTNEKMQRINHLISQGKGLKEVAIITGMATSTIRYNLRKNENQENSNS